jgi:anti-sigma factor RsiW
MNIMDFHVTSDQLQEYIDGRMTAEMAGRVGQHFGVCEKCRSAHALMRGIDIALRHQQLEQVSAGFTHTLMAKINLSEKPSLVFSFFEKIPYLLGLAVVLAVMVTVFVVTGVMQWGEVSGTGDSTSQALTAIGSGMNHAFASLSVLLSEYFPFLFGNKALAVVVFVMIGLGFLAVADRIYSGRLTHRTRWE